MIFISYDELSELTREQIEYIISRNKLNRSRRMNGYVRNIVQNRMYGFIIGEDGKEYFFHRDEFNGHWRDIESDFGIKKDRINVEFEPTNTDKGYRALKVNRLDFPNQSA